jgi:hypothetical protein
VLVFSNCSLLQKEELDPEDLLDQEITSQSENRWNQGPPDYQFLDSNGNIAKNPFFDFISNTNQSNRTVEFYPVIAAKSDRHFEFDRVSGKLYRKYNYSSSLSSG